jgi:23S rRNA pseudouridine1911/1915/1917 synthase
MVEILFEDDFCIVVAKPPGLLTQAPLGIDSLEVRIKRYLAGDSPGRDVYLGVPHRLDRPVSGVIVFAKTLKAAQRLSKQFENRRVEKTYWALVEGNVMPDEATWTDPLKKIACEPRAIVAPEGDPEARIAILHYRVLKRLHVEGEEGGHSPPYDRTLVEITLETGRNHQIRVQCASRGYPLLGDELYGSRIPFGPWSDDERQRLIALHARRLRFWHHTARQHITAEASLPDYWREAGVNEPAPARPATAD